jgi:hypothetical protein
VEQFDCHPEASVLCAAKDLGEPREASRSLRRARFLTKLHHCQEAKLFNSASLVQINYIPAQFLPFVTNPLLTTRIYTSHDLGHSLP